MSVTIPKLNLSILDTEPHHRGHKAAQGDDTVDEFAQFFRERLISYLENTRGGKPLIPYLNQRVSTGKIDPGLERRLIVHLRTAHLSQLKEQYKSYTGEQEKQFKEAQSNRRMCAGQLDEEILCYNESPPPKSLESIYSAAEDLTHARRYVGFSLKCLNTALDVQRMLSHGVLPSGFCTIEEMLEAATEPSQSPVVDAPLAERLNVCSIQ